MGLTKRQQEERSGKPSKGKQRTASLFFTWRPDKESMAEFLDYSKDPSEVLGDLTGLLHRGIKITLSYRDDQDVFLASAVEQVEWPSPAKGISVWNQDATRAFLGLVYAASQLFPEFPDCAWPPNGPLTDW
jgi:hypothetical protein